MKTKLLLIWRILVGAGMIAILYLVGLITYEYIKDCRKQKAREYYTYYGKYSNSHKYEWHKGNVRLKDAKSGKYITPKFKDIYEGAVNDTLTVFFTEDKRGFLNVYTGEITIPEQYERAWIFSEGLGAVVKDDKLGFINKSGEIAIPFQYKWKSASGEKGDFLFKDGYCAVFDSTGKHGIIDKAGKWVVQPQYEYINNKANGYWLVSVNGKYGLLNDALLEAFHPEYDKIALEKEGIIVRKGSDQKLYDYDAKTILQSFVYDNLYDLHYNSGNLDESGEDIYLKSDYISFFVDDKVGLMDKDGQVVVKAIYENISAIKNDLFSCRVAGYNHHITINGKGQVIFNKKNIIR